MRDDEVEERMRWIVSGVYRWVKWRVSSSFIPKFLGIGVTRLC